MVGGSSPAWRPISSQGPYGPLSRSTAQPMGVMSELRVAGGTAISHNRQAHAPPRGRDWSLSAAVNKAGLITERCPQAATAVGPPRSGRDEAACRGPLVPHHSP